MTEAEYGKVLEHIKEHIRIEPLNVSVVVIWPDYSSYQQSRKSKGKVKAKPVMTDEVQKAFEVFWKEYPGISRFEYKGKKFPGERVLKSNKQICLKLYSECLQSLEKSGVIYNPVYSLKKALQVQLENIRIESYKTGQNRMQYLKSCEVYLRQRAYEPWLSEEMPVPIVEQKPVLQNSTDM